MISRRLPIPISFFVVVSAVIFLIIFFGAWAVSADAGDRGRAFSLGFVSGATATNATAINASQASLGEGEDGDNTSDSWWGGAFLKACPFH